MAAKKRRKTAKKRTTFKLKPTILFGIVDGGGLVYDTIAKTKKAAEKEGKSFGYMFEKAQKLRVTKA